MEMFKLFRTLKSRPGKIFPLFIDKTTPVPIGEWVQARCHPTTGYALRPGWHCTPHMYAPQLLRKDGTMAPDRVWARVEIPNSDNGWEEYAANKRPYGIIAVPVGGYYRFFNRTNGTIWFIAGEMKVIKVYDQ